MVVGCVVTFRVVISVIRRWSLCVSHFASVLLGQERGNRVPSVIHTNIVYSTMETHSTDVRIVRK